MGLKVTNADTAYQTVWLRWYRKEMDLFRVTFINFCGFHTMSLMVAGFCPAPSPL